MQNYVGDINDRADFCSNIYSGASPHTCEILHFCDFTFPNCSVELATIDRCLYLDAYVSKDCVFCGLDNHPEFFWVTV